MNLGFVDYAAIVGWAIVVLQNGIKITGWILGKVREAKAIK
jgi:hypothetical protein